MTQLQQTNPLTAGSMASLNLNRKQTTSRLSSHVIYAGKHPAYEGWQIAFQFGAVQVSVIWTPTSRGVEVYAWKDGEGLWENAFCHMNKIEVRKLLIELMEKYSKG